MTIDDPYLSLDFSDAEREFYKLVIQASTTPRPGSKQFYNKVKATDLIEISKYSKPKVYDLIKKLEEKNLIQIDNTRPMFLKPLDPEVAIRHYVENKKENLDLSATEIIKDLKTIPKSSINFPFSDIPPLNFVTGIEDHHKLLRAILNNAKKRLYLIIGGYLVKYEEEILKEYLEKMKGKIEIRILYGGPPKFRIHFRKNVIDPIGLKDTQKGKIIDIKAINFAPPIRMTVVDDQELIMTLIKSEKMDLKINITEVSALHSNNRDLIEYATRTYIMLRPTADADLGKDFKG